MYVTTRVREAPPKQLSFEDLFDIMLNQRPDPIQPAPRASYTKTFYVDVLPQRIMIGCHPDLMIASLKRFNARWEHLRSVDMSSHYRKFFIPKKTGGMREINAPDDDLMTCLTELKNLLVSQFYASHHAAAYAYVEGRCTRDAVAVHQRNDSKWFLKIDLSKFFPSTTLEFTMNMLRRMYPFAIVMQWPDGEEELRKALSLGFLNGGLPMGTPLSPMLTNLIMIPFDYEFSRYLRKRYFNGKAYSTDDGSGQYDSTKHHGWYELEDIDPHDYFEYAGGVLSMSFEGPLYEVLNGYLGEYSREVCEKFDDIFHRYGLYYELGNSWNLSAYEE